MEVVDEVLGGSNDRDLSVVVKGKRRKRTRPQSPIPLAIPRNVGEREGVNEEDEDVARCLILLSQSEGRETPQPHYDTTAAINNNKFSSKKYLETTTTTGNKAGMYVYECKTCSRTFPSFQALGGHRASHKKAKPPLTIETRNPFSLDDDDEEDDCPSPYNGNNNSYYNNVITNMSRFSSPHRLGKYSPKIHECSYCGVEFTSGQALGGHMRRHRGAIATAAATSLLLLSPAFNVDINLPSAPESDHIQPHSSDSNYYYQDLCCPTPQHWFIGKQ